MASKTDIPVESKHIGAFAQDTENLRRHTPRNVDMIEQSIRRDGFGRSMLAASDGVVLAGNATWEGTGQAGMEEAIVVHSDGTRPIIVVRDDLKSTDERARRLAIADNRATDLGSFDAQAVVEMAKKMDLSDFWTTNEMESLLRQANKGDGGDAGIDPLPDVWGIVIELDTEQEQTALLSELAGRGFRVRALL